MAYLAYIILGLSFLNPNSFLPWPNFQQEFLVILSLFLVIIANFKKLKEIYIPYFLILSGFLIILIILIQLIWGGYYFKQDIVLFLIYLSLFYISFIISYNNFIKVDNILNIFICVSIISVIVQIFQWLNVESVFIRNSYLARPSGNLGQPNQLSTLLFLGLFSLFWIKKKYNLSNIVLFLISIFLVFGIALTDSRTSWLVFIFSLCLLLLKKEWFIFKHLFFIIIFYIVSFIFIKNINNSSVFNNNFNSNSDFRGVESLRFYNWNQLFSAVWEQPYLGYGVNQTSIAQTIISEKTPKVEFLEYSHNIFLDLFLWFGVPFGLLISSIFIYFLLKNYFLNKNVNSSIVLLISAFLIHCNLEYPFAYAYFLIPMGFILGSFYSGNFFEVKKKYFLSFFSIIVATTLLIFFEYNNIKKNNENYHYKILDVLALSEFYKIKDYCDIKNDSLDNFKNLYYRYPTGKNIYLYTYSALNHNQVNEEIKTYLSYQVNDVEKSLNIMKNKLSKCY